MDNQNNNPKSQPPQPVNPSGQVILSNLEAPKPEAKANNNPPSILDKNSKNTIKSLYIKAALLIFVPMIILFFVPLSGILFFLLAVIVFFCVLAGIAFAAVGVIKGFREI